MPSLLTTGPRASAFESGESTVICDRIFDIASLAACCPLSTGEALTCHIPIAACSTVTSIVSAACITATPMKQALQKCQSLYLCFHFSPIALNTLANVIQVVS